MDAYLGKEVVLEQVGRRELGAPGVQRFEHRVRVELVVHRNEDEKQATSSRLGQDLGQSLAVFPQVLQCVELRREVAEALPQESVRLRQAARIERSPELHEVVLIEGVVSPAQIQAAAFDEGSRILFSNEAIPEFSSTLPIPLCVDILRRHPVQFVDNREGENTDGRQPLLSVDDCELPIALSVNDQRPHVVTALGLPEKIEDVVPEVLPLLLRPGVVALVRRNVIRLAVGDQLQVVDGGSAQHVGPAHDYLGRRVPWCSLTARGRGEANMGRLPPGVKGLACARRFPAKREG